MFLILAGHPATGKTTLSEKLKAIYPEHTLLHTDDYMEHGYKESVYKLIEDLESYKFHNVIVEGIMGARLMRKLQEVKPDVKPNMYVHLRGTPRLIEETYTRERPGKKFDVVMSAIKGLDTVDLSIDKTPSNDTIFLDLEIDDYSNLDLSKLNI